MRIGTAALAACVASFAFISAGCRGTETAGPAAEPRAPAAVAVAPVKGVDEPVIIEATGSFQAGRVIGRGAGELGPRHRRRRSTSASMSRKGAVLIRIQAVDANLRLQESRAAVERAEANLKLAESQNSLAQTTARRNEALLKGGLVPQTTADEARTQAETAANSVLVARASLAQSRAQLALAEKAVTDVVVIAPFAGYVSAASRRRRRVRAAVDRRRHAAPHRSAPAAADDPQRAGRATLPAGQAVIARVDAFPGKTFEGKISAVNPPIAAESRSFIVEARVPNPGAQLKPGMFAVASIDQGRTERAMLVPKRAVVEDVNTNSFRVFVVDKDNIARVRVVQLAARQNQPESTKILTGIKEGERVATSNLADLYDGAVIRSPASSSRVVAGA